MRKKFICTVTAIAAAALLPSLATAYDASSARFAVRPGLLLPENDVINIAVLHQEIDVSEYGAGGVSRPHADWTAQARSALSTAMKSALAERKMALLPIAIEKGATDTRLHDYRALFDTVAQSVISHKLLTDDRLPTKAERFDWTLGPALSNLTESRGAQYALFFGTTDGYPSASRLRLEALGAAVGVDVEGGEHRGYAALIEIATGDLLWYKVDVRMNGDVRTAKGAQRRVEQLLANFPRRGNAGSKDE